MKNAIIEEEEDEADDFPRPDMKPREKPLMDDADLSLFTKKKPVQDDDDDDLSGYRPKVGKGQRFESTFAAGLDDNAEDMEKYRPQNYEALRPKGDDINDLMDYYSSFKTQRSALSMLPPASRLAPGTGMAHPPSGDPEQDDWGFQQDLQREMTQRKKFSDPGAFSHEPMRLGKKYSDPEDRYGGDMENPPNPFSSLRSRDEPVQFRSKFDYGDSLDPATRLILDRARDTRGGFRTSVTEQPMDYAPEPRAPMRRPQTVRARGEFDDEFQAMRPSPEPERRRTEESTLSPTTRAMLEKLKQSTQELQGLTEEQDELVTYSKQGGARAGQRKSSRFLRKVSNEDDPRLEEED